MHPLTPDLSGLSDDELHSRRADLTSKLNFAYRSGNGDMAQQLQLVLGDYGLEVEKRNMKALEDAQRSGRLASTDTATDITK